MLFTGPVYLVKHICWKKWHDSKFAFIELILCHEEWTLLKKHQAITTEKKQKKRKKEKERWYL